LSNLTFTQCMLLKYEINTLLNLNHFVLFSQSMPLTKAQVCLIMIAQLQVSNLKTIWLKCVSWKNYKRSLSKHSKLLKLPSIMRVKELIAILPVSKSHEVLFKFALSFFVFVYLFYLLWLKWFISSLNPLDTNEYFPISLKNLQS